MLQDVSGAHRIAKWSLGPAMPCKSGFFRGLGHLMMGPKILSLWDSMTHMGKHPLSLVIGVLGKREVRTVYGVVRTHADDQAVSCTQR